MHLTASIKNIHSHTVYISRVAYQVCHIRWQNYVLFVLYLLFDDAEWLALPASDHGVAGSNPARGEILPEPKRRFIAQSLSCSSFHRLEMTEILLKGCKTLTHPSIFDDVISSCVRSRNNCQLPVQQPFKLSVYASKRTFLSLPCYRYFENKQDHLHVFNRNKV